MSSFDDLPKRDHNHALEDETEAAFQALIARSSDFVYQGGDRKDYGTDCEIGVVINGHTTNVRDTSKLLSLHAGNFARFQVRPSEFSAWQKMD